MTLTTDGESNFHQQKGGGKQSHGFYPQVTRGNHSSFHAQIVAVSSQTYTKEFLLLSTKQTFATKQHRRLIADAEWPGQEMRAHGRENKEREPLFFVLESQV